MTRTALVLALSLLSAPLLAQNNSILDPGRLAGMKARSIGPAAMSGRVGAVAGVESNPDILYAGAANGGVWKSVNGGLTWAPLFDDQKVASIGAIAVYQANPDIVWVGTGEGNPRNSVSVGNGVYRSLDGGRTWSHLGLDATEHISRIVLHPTNPDVAWVAALGKLWGENAERGVYKTTDGGKSWRRVLYVDERTGAANLVRDPRNPNKLFAALWDHRRWPWSFRSGGPGSGLYVTFDGGETWKRSTEEDGLPKGELGRIGLAISHSNPEIVYALVEAEKSALVRSDDGGKSWKTVNDDPRTADRPFYYADIEVDPAWPNRLYNLTARLQVSNDGGKTFDTLARREIHGDYHAIWIDPVRPEHILVGNDGGLGLSRDRGATWDFIDDLPIGQYYHIAVDMDVPYHVYGGLQDNGSWRGPVEVWEQGPIRNQHWDRIGSGDGFDTRADPEDSWRGWSLSQGGDLLRWNLHSGEAKSIKPAEIHPMAGPNDPAGRLRFNWNAGFAVDPFEPGTIYLGSQYVHKSTDRGDTWTVISPDLTSNNPAWQKQAESGGLTPDVSGAENFTTILAITPSPLRRGVLWVGTDDGRIHVTKDGGKSWDSVEKNVHGVPAGTWIPHILASHFDAGTAFVVFDNHRRSDWNPYVVKTTDWGKTWTSLATKELWGWTEAIEQDPVDRDLLFLGTSFGLYVSRDGGRHWMRWTSGLPTTEVADLIVHPRDHDLVIATHGRALYVLDDITPLRGLTAAALQEPLRLYPSAPGRLHQNLMGGYRGGAGDFRGENRPYGLQLTYSLNLPGLPLADEKEERERKEKERADARQAAETGKAPAGGKQATLKEDPARPPAAAEGDDKGRDKEPKVQIRITDASGKLVRTMEGPAKLGMNRAVWDLGRDAFKTPPTDNRGRPRDNDSGPKVPPGPYNVTVKYKDHEAKGTVQVATDPYTKNTDADWQAREVALHRVAALQDATVTAIERIKAAHTDVDLVLKKLEPAGKDKTAKGDDDPNNAPNRTLRKAGRDLQKKLSHLESRLHTLPSAKGITDDQTVITGAENVRESLDSSWDKPNANQLASLDAAEARAKTVFADLNKLFAEDVAAFRKQVADAKIDLLAPESPITF
jgi:photosystem II stability/assembly factor-like uncharacterized protein